MRILVVSFAMGLAVVQTATPIPRQTTDSTTAASSTVQNKGKNHHAPPAARVTVANPAQTPAPETHSAKKTKEDEADPVTISKLPAVSITKDWADWSYWFFGGLLVIVGSLQVFLLHRTLGAIKRQADLMASQHQAMKDRERGRLSLEIQSYTLDSIPKVAYVLTCHGTTPAYTETTWEFAQLAPFPDYPWSEKAMGFRLQDFPKVIPVGEFKGFVFIHGTNKPDRPVSVLEDALKQGTEYLHFRARVVYRDIFDGAHELRISKVYGLPPIKAPSGMLGFFDVRYPEWRDSKYAYGESEQEEEAN